MKALLIIPLLLVGMGLADKHTSQPGMQHDLENEMTKVCQQSYKVSDGPLELRCGTLIDAVQADGKHEVLSKDGKFWTENL